ncbi:MULTISPECIES: hypothetical protein [Aerococcus]|uniref:Uncharacterized protein n=1 Tax=Aerococcus tenax TaxID=3078812 RepID=A0A5N1BKU2_9LACT|nr:hypothetical protein [Aerococcus urinae]KAA9238779.1 hypothetical protein F6I34_07675 [Aerococcus urinae]MDK6598446.1 hypothetical protein [Aerococcus urinae]MDK7303556.1 hypothetical protein [Aerococcus urinae]MDK7802589.1 hypothetical protein [Aerococcus urinae]MDK8656174.1 hypothetical protein [Aerococcus urinae]
MNTSRDQQRKIAIIATIITVLLVAAFYLIGKQRQTGQNNVAYESKSQASSQVESQAPKTSDHSQAAKRFEDKRQEATLSDYLAYINQAGTQAKVATVKVQGESDQWLSELIKSKGQAADLDLNVQAYDYAGHSSQSLLTSDLVDQVAKEKPHLLILPLTSEVDFAQGRSLEDTLVNLKQVYGHLRIASPETNIVFLALPSYSEAANGQGTYGSFLVRLIQALEESHINIMDLNKAFEAKNFDPEKIYDQESGLFNDQGFKALADLFGQALQEEHFDLSHGFQGKNDDKAALEESMAKESQSIRDKKQAEAQEAQAEAEAAAARQSQAAESQRQEEAKQREAAQAEADRQAQAAQGQQQQQQSQVAPNQQPANGQGQAPAPQAPAAGNNNPAPANPYGGQGQ